MRFYPVIIAIVFMIPNPLSSYCQNNADYPVVFNQVQPVKEQGITYDASYETDKTDTKNNLQDFSVYLMPDSNKQKCILSISNPSLKNLIVFIVSPSGTRFSIRTDQLTFRTRINLTEEEDGIYTINVRSGKKTITREITLKTSIEETRRIIFK